MADVVVLALLAGLGWILGEAGKSASRAKDRAGAAPGASAWKGAAGHRPSPDRVRSPPRQPPSARAAAADKPIDVLPEYRLVRDMVRAGFPLIFVTGGAGTGKSTFVRWLTREFDGEVLLAAPTGIAALNIDGKTLHSLCNLPPAWLLKSDVKIYRRDLATQAKLLIIDEISMVDANLLDGVNAFFRRNRESAAPFGGLPVVIVGDLFQLPPIVTRQKQALFDQDGYVSTKFFGSHLLKKAPYYAIELRKAFRQVDQEFVDLLAKVREGVDVDQCVATLNQRCTITTEPPKHAVWLSPRNAEVDRRNAIELSKLAGLSQFYEGVLTGKFKGDRLPSPQRLELRVGAQVMFTKNGSQWVNGTVGSVERLLPDRVEVRLAESGSVVDVGRAVWEQFDYDFNRKTGQVERSVVGEYSQIPLMLAWSMTIHKSQGKTIERVHLDLGAGAFETGQTYVALSRCRSLDALTLSRHLRDADVLVDAEARAFYGKLRELIRAVPPAAMAQKMGLAYSDSDKSSPKRTAGASAGPVVPDTGQPELVVEEDDPSMKVQCAGWFACPLCKRRYAMSVWQPRFTCEDKTCQMTWSPSEARVVDLADGSKLSA